MTTTTPLCQILSLIPHYTPNHMLSFLRSPSLINYATPFLLFLRYMFFFLQAPDILCALFSNFQSSYLIIIRPSLSMISLLPHEPSFNSSQSNTHWISSSTFHWCHFHLHWPTRSSLSACQLGFSSSSHLDSFRSYDHCRFHNSAFFLIVVLLT